MYAFIHACACTRTHTCILTHTHTYANTLANIHTYVCHSHADMAEPQRALFTTGKVDGKGHVQRFVKCWAGLQCVLSKVADKGMSWAS